MITPPSEKEPTGSSCFALLRFYCRNGTSAGTGAAVNASVADSVFAVVSGRNGADGTCSFTGAAGDAGILIYHVHGIPPSF
jgi:hypothetical protein